MLHSLILYTSILKQKCLVSILIYRFLSLNIKLHEQYLNMLCVYPLFLINRKQGDIHFDIHAPFKFLYNARARHAQRNCLVKSSNNGQNLRQININKKYFL